MSTATTSTKPAATSMTTRYHASPVRTLTADKVAKIEADMINAWNDPANQLNTGGKGTSVTLSADNFEFIRNSILMHYALNGASRGTEKPDNFPYMGVEYDPVVIDRYILAPRRFMRYYSDTVVKLIKEDAKARDDMANTHKVDRKFAHLVFDGFDSFLSLTPDEMSFVEKRKVTKTSGRPNDFSDMAGKVDRRYLQQTMGPSNQHAYESDADPF